METKKTFEVIQIIPATTYITYHVEATNEDEAESLVRSYADSIVKIGESTYEADNIRDHEYDVYELN